LVQRRGQDPLDPGPARRLDPLFPAVGQQLYADLIRAPLGLRDVLGQPRGQLLRIRDGAFPETQRPTDLRPVCLDLPARPVIETELSPRHSHLFGDELDDFIRQLPTTSREPTPVGEELQQQREAQPGRARLVAQPRHLVRQKRKVLDELVQLQPTRQAAPPAGDHAKTRPGRYR